MSVYAIKSTLPCRLIIPDIGFTFALHTVYEYTPELIALLATSDDFSKADKAGLIEYLRTDSDVDTTPAGCEYCGGAPQRWNSEAKMMESDPNGCSRCGSGRVFHV